jgi:MFS family permease
MPPPSRSAPVAAESLAQARPARKRAVTLAVLVAALGYFVDIYDLILFSIVRIESLRGIGVPEDRILPTGVMLLNTQMAGMLLGGIIWGILGDKRGRISVLFGSIFLYSIANLLNGLVTSVPTYAALRLIAGIGLAGELGAGVTLVAESMSREMRGYGTMIIATIGIFGAVVAALVGDFFDWRTAYFVGGGMGFALLALRIGVYESGMFESVKSARVRRGDFTMLFTNWAYARKYVSVILIAVPIWYVVAIPITFSPELGRAMSMTELPNPGRAVMFCYIGLAIGDFSSGVLSQYFRSRKEIIFAFIMLTGWFIGVYFLVGSFSLRIFYVTCVLIGIAAGYWAVFITTAAEQFGTNIRATVTTTAPNFVRGAVVPLTTTFQALSGPLGIRESALVVGAFTIVVALIALRSLEETYGKDLDYIEV